MSGTEGHHDHHPHHITTRIPLQMCTSRHYIPFWLLTCAKFLLFLTNNMITALSTTIYGNAGSFAMTLMYIAFIFGNFLAPSFNAAVGHNMALVMFIVSIIYTLFAFVSTIVVIGMDPTKVLISQSAAMAIFYAASIITGLAGGALWIGYGVLNIQLGESIPKKLWKEYNENHPDEKTNPEADLDQFTEAVTGKIMSVGWSLLSLNTVVGGILAWGVLKLFHGPNALPFLFVCFSGISILANIVYFILYRYCTSEMSMNNLDSIDATNGPSIPSPSAGPQTGPTSPLLFPKSPSENVPRDSVLIDGQGQEATLLLNSKFQQHLENTAPVSSSVPNPVIARRLSQLSYGSTCSELDHESHDGLENDIEMSQWEIFTDLLKTPYVTWSFFEYFFAGIAFNYIFASFMSNTIQATLGLASAPLIVTVAYSANTIASFFIGNFLTSRLAARSISMIGNAIQLLPALLALFSPPASVGSVDAWGFGIAVAILAGIGDAIHMSSLSTVMASDLKHDADLGGFRFKYVADQEKKELKEILYSIYSSVKSIGVFATFLASGTLSFEWQSQIVFFTGILSLFGQRFLRNRILDQQVLF